MPKTTADPTRIVADSGIAELDAELGQLRAGLEADQTELRRLTSLDNQRRQRGPAASLGTDLDQVLALQAASDQLDRDIKAFNDKIVLTFRRINELRDQRAATLDQLDSQLRPAFMAARQERLARITRLALEIADALEADRLANGAAETLMAGAGLKPLGIENVLASWDSRLNVLDYQLPVFSDMTREWTERGWLVGDVAERAKRRAADLFNQRERDLHARNERYAAVERQAKLDDLARRRVRIASGDLKISGRLPNGTWRVMSIEEGLAWFDRQHSGAPRPALVPVTAGELVG